MVAGVVWKCKPRKIINVSIEMRTHLCKDGQGVRVKQGHVGQMY